MIEFQVLNSPDKDAVGTFLFFFEKFTLGRDSKSQFTIDDKQICPAALSFECVESGLFLNNKNQEYFWINGKKVSGKILMKPGDILSLGATEIKLLNYSYQDVLKAFNLYDKVEETEAAHPELEPVLRAIEDELLYLESVQDD